MSKTVRNGKIEFLRFAFAVIIMLFHMYESFLPVDYKVLGNFTFFANGWFGVEFFFVVSGFFMASTAFKRRNDNKTIGKATFDFMWKKLMAVLPYHLLVFSISFVLICILNKVDLSDFLNLFIKGVPNFLLIQRSGLVEKDVLGVEWYISEMLIAMLIIYPVCHKHYDRFTKTIAPVLSLLILGYLIKTTGTLGGSKDWSVLVSKTLLRAIAEICAGAFAFEVCRNIQKLKFTKIDRAFLSGLELFSYGIVLLFVVYDFPGSYAGTIVIFACVAICLSFSNLTFGNKLFNNKVVRFLGSLSLPLYLCQSAARVFVKLLYKEYLDFKTTVLVFFVSTFCYAIFAYFVEKVLIKLINKKVAKLTER